jgi:hypothetical protein
MMTFEELQQTLRERHAHSFGLTLNRRGWQARCGALSNNEEGDDFFIASGAHAKAQDAVDWVLAYLDAYRASAEEVPKVPQ